MRMIRGDAGSVIAAWTACPSGVAVEAQAVTGARDLELGDRVTQRRVTRLARPGALEAVEEVVELGRDDRLDVAAGRQRALRRRARVECQPAAAGGQVQVTAPHADLQRGAQPRTERGLDPRRGGVDGEATHVQSGDAVRRREWPTAPARALVR